MILLVKFYEFKNKLQDKLDDFDSGEFIEQVLGNTAKVGLVLLGIFFYGIALLLLAHGHVLFTNIFALAGTGLFYAIFEQGNWVDDLLIAGSVTIIFANFIMSFFQLVGNPDNNAGDTSVFFFTLPLMVVGIILVMTGGKMSRTQFKDLKENKNDK